MQVTVAPGCPFEALFLLGWRAAHGNRPAERVGAVIAKQGCSLDDPMQSWAAEPVRFQDELYPGSSEDFPRVRVEADIVPCKPRADLVVVPSEPTDEPLGHFTIRRGKETSSSGPVKPGWRDRGRGSRCGAAGDLSNWSADRDGLPDKFDNGFFNGGHTQSARHFFTGNQITWTGAAPIRVTIPPAPETEVEGPDDAPRPDWPPWGVDTVVFLLAPRRVLLTWRLVFPWNDLFATLTLRLAHR